MLIRNCYTRYTWTELQKVLWIGVLMRNMGTINARWSRFIPQREMHQGSLTQDITGREPLRISILTRRV